MSFRSLLLVGLLTSAPLLAADPKPTKYPFTKPPLELLDEFAKADLGKVPLPTEDERKLLAAVWEKKAKKPTEAVAVSDNDLVNLMLFASGVSDPTARKKYREKLTDLRATCGEQLEGVKDPAVRGEKMLKFVHAHAMSGGYELRQSLPTTTFDGGKFNCVSGTALVYLVGVHHGFDLRPMSIPGDGAIVGHAYLALAGGKQRLVVECTNPDGYDWEAKLKQPGVQEIGVTIDRKKAHEVDAAGLVAVVYVNRGVNAGEQKQPDRHTAIVCALCALALDPVSPSAATNVESAFANWGPAASDAGRHDEAVRVMTFALKMSPNSSPIKTNSIYCWSQAIDASIAAGKDADAVKLVERAREQWPKESNFATAAEWFVDAAWKAEKKGGWEAGIALFDRGLKVVPTAEKKELHKKRYEFAQYTIQTQAKDGKYAEALKLVAAEKLALDADQRTECGGGVYHIWADKLAEAEDKEKAIEKYAEGAKVYPKHTVLAGNGVVTAIQWGQEPQKAKNWDEAIRRYDVGLKHFKDDKDLLELKKECEEEKKKKPGK